MIEDTFIAHAVILCRMPSFKNILLLRARPLKTQSCRRPNLARKGNLPEFWIPIPFSLALMNSAANERFLTSMPVPKLRRFYSSFRTHPKTYQSLRLCRVSKELKISRPLLLRIRVSFFAILGMFILMDILYTLQQLTAAFQKMLRRP